MGKKRMPDQREIEEDQKIKKTKAEFLRDMGRLGRKYIYGYPQPETNNTQIQLTPELSIFRVSYQRSPRIVEDQENEEDEEEDPQSKEPKTKPPIMTERELRRRRTETVPRRLRLRCPLLLLISPLFGNVNFPKMGMRMEIDPNWRDVVHAWRLPGVKRTHAKFPISWKSMSMGKRRYREIPLRLSSSATVEGDKNTTNANKPPNESFHGGPTKLPV